MMAVLAGFGWAMGVPWQVVTVAAAAWVTPFGSAATVLALLAHQLRSHRSEPAVGPDIRLLLGVASDLRAGQSLRMALLGACSSYPGERLKEVGRMIEAGRPTPAVADELTRALGRTGLVLGAAVRMSASTGGATAALFEELAAQVMQAEDLRREMRAAAAPVLAQGVIVGGLPLMAIVWMAASGRLVSVLSAGPVQAGIVVVGLVLVLCGVGMVAALMWRSHR